MVLEGFSIGFGGFWEVEGGVGGRGMDLALPWSPPDPETNKKLPYKARRRSPFMTGSSITMFLFGLTGIRGKSPREGQEEQGQGSEGPYEAPLKGI